MSLANGWTALASRLGTSPRQLALLLLSAVAAIGIFAGKLVMAPKASTAASTAAPATPIATASTTTSSAIPAEFIGTMPTWNLATTPTRSPFQQPIEAKPNLVAQTATVALAPEAAPVVSLQATLDTCYAVLDGRTLRVGQSWTDSKTGQRFQLMKVGQRSVTLASAAGEYEIHMDLVLSNGPQ